MISLLVAELLMPFLQFYFIRKPMEQKIRKDGKKPFSFLDMLQGGYNRLLAGCFAHPWLTLGVGVVSVVVGIYMMGLLPQRLLPAAERNQFAVEIYMPTGTAVEKTAQVADSLEHILRRDKRVVSVASFKGCGSLRFQNSYAPQMGGPDFAQFIVNTLGNDETVELLDEYTPKSRGMFPEAVVRFKQLGYSEAIYPIEVRLSGDDLALLKKEAERVTKLLCAMPELNLVRTNFNEPMAATRITFDEDQSTRLGLSNIGVESTLAMRYGSGTSVDTVWEGDYDIPVMLKSIRSDSATVGNVRDELLPVGGGVASVPLRSVAKVETSWEDGQVVRRNGVRTITVMAETERGVNVMEATAKVQKLMEENPVADGVRLTYGGELEENEDYMPQIMGALVISVAIIFFILVFHFKCVMMATLMLVCLSLCLFGTATGVLIQGVDFGVTCTLGIVSLMGILVRNGIIMIDYAEELRRNEHMNVHDAIYHSAQRRMRPIFLTSAAASMGVIPMKLGGSGLWMPMGTLIFYGTLITMFFILTVIPVAYWKVLAGSTGRRANSELIEQQ